MASKSNPEHELLLAKKGDPVGLRALYDRFKNLAFFRAWQVVRASSTSLPLEVEREIVENVVRDTFCAVLDEKNLNRIVDVTHLRRWLRLVVTRKALNGLRAQRAKKRKLVAFNSELVESRLDCTHDPLDEAASHDLREELFKRAGLNDQSLTVIILRASGLSPQQIADEMGLDVGNVNVIVHRARNAIQSALSAMEEEDRHA